MDAATAFPAIKDAMDTISVFTSSRAFFFSRSISRLARSRIRPASALASSRISASCFFAFFLASSMMASASLLMDRSFSSYSAWSARALSLLDFAISRSPAIFFLLFSR